jgi:hypothetical protein
MGLGIYPGQQCCGRPALGVPTCRLSGHVHSVWSQSGPKRLPGVEDHPGEGLQEPAHGRDIAGHSLPVTLIGLAATTGLDILLKPDW